MAQPQVREKPQVGDGEEEGKRATSTTYLYLPCHPEPYRCSWKGDRLGVVGGMKQNHYRTHAGSAHQTVTEEIKVKTGEKTIRMLAGKQKLSDHAG